MIDKLEVFEDILGRKISLNESTISVVVEVRLKLQEILGRSIDPSESVEDVLKEYQRKKMYYTLYLNDEFYGIGPLDYMTELFRDYVEYCDMYGKESVKFEVIRGRGRPKGAK